MFSNSTLFIRIDLEDRHSYTSILDPNEDLVEWIAPPT